jgi:TPR repeat protein
MASITTRAHGTQFLLAFRAALSAWLALGSFAGLVACGPDIDSAPRDRAAHSPTKQMQRLRQDADQGSRLAQYVLGVMYQLGEIVPQDYAEAVKWVRRAADQDFTVAQFVLGEMYAVGHGVPEDDVRAHMWLSLSETRAAHIGSAEARE